MSYEKPTPTNLNFDFSQSRAYSKPDSDKIHFNFVPEATSENTITPFGIFQDGYGAPILKWTEFARNVGGIDSVGFGYHAINHSTAVPNFNFSESTAYTAPEYNSIRFIFGNGGVPGLVLPPGIANPPMGSMWIYNNRVIGPVGNIFATSYGAAKIENVTTYVKPLGFNASAFPYYTQIINFHKNVNPAGFNPLVFGKPTIYNLRQQLFVPGRVMAIYGTAYVQGGVKEVRGSGFNSAVLPQPKVVNTRADQYVDLRSPSGGIGAPNLIGPNVSPRHIRPQGIIAWTFGNAWVQRNPSPKGFTTDIHGTAWVSHSPRYISPFKVDGYVSGYAEIFDPTQKIYHADSPKITGGIFGDISVKNIRKIIEVKGSYQTLYGDWSTLYSNLTDVTAQPFDAALFGDSTIWNKTPSILPDSFEVGVFGETLIADRIRRINTQGFSPMESLRFGQHTFTKTPEFNVRGFESLRFGTAFVSNKVRHIFAGVGPQSRLSNDLTIWYRYRFLNGEGFNSQRFSSPTLTHSERNLIAQGLSFATLGRPTTWYRVRKIEVEGIYKDFASNHSVGGTQYVRGQGFDTALFGTRIVPENLSLYPLTFDAQGFSETTQIELYKRWVRPLGFHSFGVQASDRYGTATLWNLQQYIGHNYDSGDGLNPGEFGQWTSIVNRNRNVRATGQVKTKFGTTQIDNKARPLHVQGYHFENFGANMIAYRVRKIVPDTIESQPISAWGRVYNSADVIGVKGFSDAHYGSHTIFNTRRQYRWVGAFESLEFGNPMIAFKIRNVYLETRYSINPPHLPVHRVDLHTRYVDVVGEDFSRFGGIDLHIKWNKITPRWFHQEKFGDSYIWNLTPELRQRGNVTEEFGQSKIFLYRQDIFIDGYRTELFGKNSITYLDRSLHLAGANYMRVGLHKVVKTGAPPYSLQYIYLNELEADGDIGGQPGRGISPPDQQVSRPNLKTNVIFVEGFIATRYGSHHTQSNGILLEAGIQEFAIGNHFVGLKNRTIVVPTMGDFGQWDKDKAKPRISPHTIYAVMEAPGQALANHSVSNLHYVNSDVGGRPPGEVFGHTSISLQHRTILVRGSDVSSFIPRSHEIQLAKRYVEPISIRSLRSGYHTLGPFDIPVDQYDSTNMALYGRPNVSHVVDLSKRYLRPAGLFSQAFGNHRVEFLHRNIYPRGTNTLLMGTRRTGDQPFMWQGLRVGELIKGKYGGFESLGFGELQVSLRVRDIQVEGFESFVLGYDHTQFNERMKVVLEPKEKPKQHISVSGFENTLYGMFNIKPKVHYIRPDGNSYQYRKGGF